MGKTTRTVTECTCDICGKECGERDGKIQIPINHGDGRDVGPAVIRGVLNVTQPYGVKVGLVCMECKKKWLSYYVDQLHKGVVT